MRNYRVLLVWAEAFLAILTGVLGIVTIFWRDWIEMLTGWDPDHHNGSFEIGLVLVLLIVSVTCAAVARRSYRRVVALSS